MSNQEIKEKYGIEPIMKEMWVWDEYKDNSIQVFVVYKNICLVAYPYCSINSDRDFIFYINASETNPNYKEPKVGDRGYFWDDEKLYCYSDLIYISPYDTLQIYYSPLKQGFKNFSHEKQPWMK
jgi:hypothetical protein